MQPATGTTIAGASGVPPPVLLERGVDVEFAQRRRLVKWM
jgi:hypothetical protein